MADGEELSGSNPPHTTKAVGTEHYRPPSATIGGADEKLDIFALGVILFELLWPFDTRMERHETLSKLKSGELPKGFAEKVGSGGQHIGKCITDMISVGDHSKLDAQSVRNRILIVLRELEETDIQQFDHM